MKRAIWKDIKNSVCNLRFLAGILLILIAAFVSEGAMLKKIADAGGSVEGPGWFMAFSYFTNTMKSSSEMSVLLFIPIAVTLAAGENTEEELRTRFYLFSSVRTGKRGYLYGKIAGLMVSGGLMVVLAMAVWLFVSIIGFSRFPTLGETEQATANFGIATGLSFVRVFLNGAMWALIGGLAAVVTKNRYMSYAVPFILYYVLSVFQERYYPKAYFLNPHYWAASIYYEEWVCIGSLSAVTLLVAVLFLLTVKRRLTHA